MTDAPAPSRIATWLDRWGDILPLLLAEFVVWLGFGGLLPVLPLYFTEQGVDLATLGLVVAAWPAARLVGEPIFGWLADRTARVPLMVIGLLVDRHLRRAAPGLHRASAVPPAARRVRARRGDLRPRGARLPDRRDAAGTPRRGVRAVRRGPDGRAAARPRDRRARRRPASAGSAFVFVFGAIAAFVAALPIGLRVRETRGADAPGAVGRLDRVPAGRRHPRRGVPPTDVDADRGASRGRRALPTQPLEPRA